MFKLCLFRIRINKELDYTITSNAVFPKTISSKLSNYHTARKFAAVALINMDLANPGSPNDVSRRNYIVSARTVGKQSLWTGVN